jgi:hypothetical protein
VALLNASLDDEQLTWLYLKLQEITGFSIRYYGVEGYDKQIFNIFGFLSDKSLILVASQGDYRPEDDFVEVIYESNSGKQYTYDELKDISDYDLQTDPPVRTNQRFKDLYFETMFYRTYVGLSDGESGSKTEPQYQVPCWGMKHFYAKFISNISQYAYYSGQSAVVIAKYYAGAMINGSLNFLGESIDAQVVVVQNITHYETSIPVDHDFTLSVNGSFNVIAPAGDDVYLQVRRYPELGSNAIVMKNISFTGAVDTDRAPITEDDAMRRGDHYQRTLNISIDPGKINGYVFIDDNYDDQYNSSVETTVSDINILLYEATTFQTETEQPEIGSVKSNTTDGDGYYETDELLPGIYQLIAVKDELRIHAAYIEIFSGEKTYNIPDPKPAGLEGIVYYDANFNDKYDDNEEITDASLELYVGDTLISSTTSASDGSYSFENLIPGKIDGLDLNEYTLTTIKDTEYELSQTLYPEENKTTSWNISLKLTPVSVDGRTEFNGEPVGDIDLQFIPDGRVVNNTAEEGEVKTFPFDGKYKLSLIPGTYNVTGLRKEEGTTVYTYEGQLVITPGDLQRTVNIPVIKHSANTSGRVTYQGTPIENVTINFRTNFTVANNTAINRQTITNINGSYAVELMPGTYDIGAFKVIDNQSAYIYTGSLVIQPNDYTETVNIALTRQE